MHVQAGCEFTVETDAPCPVVALLQPRTGVARWRIDGHDGFGAVHDASEYTDSFGNRCRRFTLPRGQTRIRIDAAAATPAELAVDPDAGANDPSQLPAETLQFLLPSRYCPSDRAQALSRALEIVGDAAPGYGQAEAIRAWIQGNLAYRYGVSDAGTDAFATLEQRAGVCRDFAHVGITLCRALDIPARMVVGWLHGLDPMDLHAWFEAYVGDAWYTFDATQTQVRGGRIVIAHGRDAADVAFLTYYRPLRTHGMRVWADLSREGATYRPVVAAGRTGVRQPLARRRGLRHGAA